MKLLMIIGGCTGFLIGLALGLAQESAWPTVLWRASAAALGAGVLMKWWGQLWIDGLAHARRERMAAAKIESSPAKA